MAAERLRATALDRTHHLELVKAHVAAIGGSQAAPWLRKMSATSRAGRAIGAARYAGGSSGCGLSVKRSNGLITVRMVLVAMWV